MKKILQAIVLILFSQSLFASDLRVAVASNFKNAMDVLIPIFEMESGHSVDVSTASSGKLFAQLRHGAPFDVFMSADTVKPQQLVKMGLAEPESAVIYATGRLVLWAPKARHVDRSYLHTSRSIAIANPRHAPYGMAAMDTIATLFPRTEHELALRSGENVGQAFQFVKAAHVDAGFVALSQVRQLNIPEHQYWLVPDFCYTAIEQQAVITRHGKSNHASAEWLRFLKRKNTQEIIQQLGYQPTEN